MIHKETATFRADIWLAGDRAVIEQACREFCYSVGLCVTVADCSFIYTGGQEAGVRVGLVNYPRFPSTPAELWARAMDLAALLMERACQHSALIVADDRSLWISRRDDCPAAKAAGKE